MLLRDQLLIAAIIFRKLNALNTELESSESELKKTETSHLEAQRKIRELERQIHMQKDHNKEVRCLTLFLSVDIA